MNKNLEISRENAIAAYDNRRGRWGQLARRKKGVHGAETFKVWGAC